MVINPNPYPKIKAPKASQVVQGFKPQPEAQALLKPDHTPAQYLDVLEKNNLSEDAVKTMAHGMPERESVWYACQSSQRVAGKLPPSDKAALGAAESWVKNPTPATRAQAASAAAKTDFNSPGGWAAQAAAFSTTTPGVPAAPVVPGVNPASLTPQAASGSVLLAAAMENNAKIPKVPSPNLPAMPEVPSINKPAVPKLPAIPATPTPAPGMTAKQLADSAKVHQPYLDLGKDIASGRNSWA